MNKHYPTDDYYTLCSSFGSDQRIAYLENTLRKNIAMRDGVPIIAKTNRGNVGVYGACGRAVVAIRPDKVQTVVDLLRTYKPQ